MQQISWPGIAQSLAQGRILFTPLGSLLMPGQGTSLPWGLPANILLSIAVVMCILQRILSHQAAPRISSLWPLRGQCFWLLSFPAKGKKDHAKGSDTFPSPLPDSARAVEVKKHGAQVDDATGKGESVGLQSPSPSQAVISRESAWQERGPCCLHLLGAEGPAGARPPPLIRHAPGPAYGA